ncbi:hypothetical protein ABID25_006675 [Mesorhizobium abyssinicae]
MLQRVFDRLCVERRLRFLFGPVLLHAPVLIAVKACCGKVAQIIGAAVHFRLLMFDGQARWTGFCEIPLAVTTFPVLAPVELAAHPGAILKVSQISHAPQRDHMGG